MDSTKIAEFPSFSTLLMGNMPFALLAVSMFFGIIGATLHGAYVVIRGIDSTTNGTPQQFSWAVFKSNPKNWVRVVTSIVTMALVFRFAPVWVAYIPIFPKDMLTSNYDWFLALAVLIGTTSHMLLDFIISQGERLLNKVKQSQEG